MLIPHGTLILVVDGGSSRIMRNAGTPTAPDLNVIEERSLHVPANRDLASDAPGRSFESAGVVRHSYPTTDRHERLEAAFGLEALQRLLDAAKDDTPMILIAPPRMLGILRSRRRNRAALAEIDKDWTALSCNEIAVLLQKLH